MKPITRAEKRYHKELRGLDARSEVEINREMSDAIVQSIRKRCRDSQREHEIISIIENNFGLATEVRKSKHIISSQLEEETLRAKRRTKDWNKIMNMVHGTKQRSDTYLENYEENRRCISRAFVCGEFSSAYLCYCSIRSKFKQKH